MQSSLLPNAIVGILLAILSYFLLPLLLPTIAASYAIAMGVVVGVVACSLIQTLGHSQGSSAEQMDENTEAAEGDTTTLYVGNLPYRANEQAVKEHFQSIGPVATVRLMKDKRTGKRKGYGFVEISSKYAENAIQQLNNGDFQDRTLKVRLAKEKGQD